MDVQEREALLELIPSLVLAVFGDDIHVNNQPPLVRLILLNDIAQWACVDTFGQECQQYLPHLLTL